MLIDDQSRKNSTARTLNQNPYTGEYIGNGLAPGTVPNGVPGLDATLGTEGVLTAYYGNPRQVFVSFGVNF